MLANKLIEKLPDLCNTKEHYQSFIRKKNTKSVKQSEIIPYQPKTFENPNLVDIRSVTTEHPKASHKSSKIPRQAEKVGSNSFLNSDTKKFKIFKRKNCSDNKTSSCFHRFWKLR